jgi:hypothetical protein
MAVQLELGLEVIHSYKRLSYKAWYALAEFVDNSTQSYFNNEEQLKQAYVDEGTTLTVSIVYDKREGRIRISDNAMGMSLEELQYGLKIGKPPANTSGRSQYGMGMKTAACWLGNKWRVRTKRLGETTEHSIEVEVDKVAAGNNVLPHSESQGKDPSLHYTVLEIEDLNRELRTKTITKVKDYLRSIYRSDIRSGLLTLLWQDEPLQWIDEDENILADREGNRYKKEFDFEVEDKRVHGWVGVLDRGSRARAGFSILHKDRVVKGWPDSWRPESIYGQIQGSNDLVNQRLIGEIHLDDFQVSHTKDDILWMGNEEEDVQQKLKEVSADYREVARTRRHTHQDERRPSDLDIQTAVEELQSEITSAEMADLLTMEPVPPPEIVEEEFRPLLESIDPNDLTFGGALGLLTVSGYLIADASSNDPYVAVESTDPAQVIVAINLNHPHIAQLSGTEGMLNYLRHCTYDAIAEWQARHKTSALDPHTIKMLKDKLLRLSLQIEMHHRGE